MRVLYKERLNTLLKDIAGTPYEGPGKPEAPKFDLRGPWSRRIDHEHRIVYTINENSLIIYSCRFHYDF